MSESAHFSTILNTKRILLASKSPRRAQLLAEAGFDFSVRTFDTDESWPPEMPLDEVAEFIAVKKARAGLPFIEGDEVVLAADTTVLIGDEILNKPESHSDAQRMLRKLSGQMHRVVTGVCLASNEKMTSFSVVSNVFMADLTDEEIDFYIERCRPFDKAGAYGVQEWIGHCKIERIEGTYANVMGLPVHAVYAALRAF